MDNDDAKRVLLEMRRIVAGIYPLKEGDIVDSRYAMALGMIAGVAVEAIHAVQQDRPMNIKLGDNYGPGSKK